ncbi:MAG: hypothetical protein D6719_11105 [Candidatus Dadabacteria bacterium]|nr:MAG: hypothetical protein D6719_11105 [Candidatus Dadabacteria bacterium]
MKSNYSLTFTLAQLLSIIVLFLFVPVCFAASDNPEGPNVSAHENSDAESATDRRMPPVLPGETVKRGGKKMKVWTTVGPVPVASPAENRQPESVQNERIRDIDVIVDGRNR